MKQNTWAMSHIPCAVTRAIVYMAHAVRCYQPSLGYDSSYHRARFTDTHEESPLCPWRIGSSSLLSDTSSVTGSSITAKGATDARARRAPTFSAVLLSTWKDVQQFRKQPFVRSYLTNVPSSYFNQDRLDFAQMVSNTVTLF